VQSSAQLSVGDRVCVKAGVVPGGGEMNLTMLIALMQPHAHSRTHAHTHAPTRTLMHPHTHSRTHTHTHSRTDTHTHTHAPTHTHTHTHTLTHPHIGWRGITATDIGAAFTAFIEEFIFSLALVSEETCLLQGCMGHSLPQGCMGNMYCKADCLLRW
jgi:hypothetical protein